VIREADTEAAAATENIARKQLNPYEEARAVKAMLDKGTASGPAAHRSIR
jgi:ParB-like chromosome segregation protein Spo0J